MHDLQPNPALVLPHATTTGEELAAAAWMQERAGEKVERKEREALDNEETEKEKEDLEHVARLQPFVRKIEEQRVREMEEREKREAKEREALGTGEGEKEMGK